MGSIRPTEDGIRVQFGVFRRTIPWDTVNRLVEEEVPEEWRNLAAVVLRSVEGHLSPAHQPGHPDPQPSTFPVHGPSAGPAGGA